jgi:hypothetical protein
MHVENNSVQNLHEEKQIHVKYKKQSPNRPGVAQRVPGVLGS